MKILICYLMTPFPAATITPIGPFKLSTHPGKGSRQEGVTEKIKWKFVRGKWGRFEPPTLILDILMGSSKNYETLREGRSEGKFVTIEGFTWKKSEASEKGKNPETYVTSFMDEAWSSCLKSTPPPVSSTKNRTFFTNEPPTHFSYTMKHYQATSDF